jgi:imidazoleglycerol-phosphate dehydratase
VALRHADEMLARVDDLRATRDELLRRGPEMGFDVVDSDANFVLIGRWADRHAAWQQLLDQGVLVRETGPDGFLRVSAGTPQEDGGVLRRAGARGRPEDGGVMARTARIERSTSESTITVELNLDGTGVSDIATGVGFYDHMLTALSKHSLIDLTVQATGDVHIDGHHVVEDTAIVIGQALREALGDKRGIRRFGDALVPLDEALARLRRRRRRASLRRVPRRARGQVYALIGGSGVPYAGSMTYHVVESLALNAGLCVHLDLVRGRDPHHIVEAQFKALARALRAAVEPDPRIADQIPSTKGACERERRGARLRLGQPALRDPRAGRDRAREVTCSPPTPSRAGADGLVVPGVGAFAACMAGLEAVGGPAIIRRDSARASRVGHLRRSTRSCSRRATSTASSPRAWASCPDASSGCRAERLPHMGWNTVAACRGVAAVRRASRGSGSTSCTATASTRPLAQPARWSPGPSTAATASSPPSSGPLSVTQFHPEKSGRAGARCACATGWLPWPEGGSARFADAPGRKAGLGQR